MEDNGSLYKWEHERDVEEVMEEKEKEVFTLIREDFNPRTDEKGGGTEIEGDGGWKEEGRRKRRTKDMGINREGRLQIDFL